MGQTRLLTNVIQRKVMLTDNMLLTRKRDNFEISLSEFSNHQILENLYKADNQRSTQYWSVPEIAKFIRGCVEDPNVDLVVYYWKDIDNNIYIIDGAHRLSCLYAWINRYFADEQVSQAPTFTDEQKRDIRDLRNRLGDLCDFQKIFSDTKFKFQKENLEDIKISFKQVIGTPEDARRVFESINSDTKTLDKNEEFHLKNRNTDAYYAIYACCYINDNRSNLEEMKYGRLNKIIELGEQTHQLLFSTILMNYDLTHGKRIGLVNELLNIVTGNHIHNLMSLDQGERVEALISQLFTILCRIATPEKAVGVPCLGLSPFLYFFKEKNFQITSFLAWFSIVFEIHQKTIHIGQKLVTFKEFTRIRRGVELLISKFPVVITETVGKFGSGIKSYEKLQIVYKAFMFLCLKSDCDFEKQEDLNTLVLSISKSFPYVNFNDFLIDNFQGEYDLEAIKETVEYVQSISPSPRSTSPVFSSTTKDLMKHQFKMNNYNLCPICDGLIHLNSTELDHCFAKSMGGQGTVENGQFVHPLCNRLKSDLTMEEIRADLFGELVS